MSRIVSSDIRPWTPAERESFFAAITRHRHAAWRVTLISRVCALAVALVVATLISPLCYALLGLVLDVVNWVISTPDLIERVTNRIGAVIDHPADVTVTQALYLWALAALPGLALMVLAMRTLSRVMGEAMTVEAGGLVARAPSGTNLTEQRLSNVVQEMALAAAVPSPQVWITESASANAAVFGRSDGEAIIVVTTGLLTMLNRAELQALAAHLVGSIADGDMRIGTRIATVLSLFGLITRLSRSFAERDAARQLAKLLRASLRRGGNAADRELALALVDPFADTPGPRDTSPHEVKSSPHDTSDKVPWRTLAWIPLMGPLVMSGLFGGVISAMLLSPLLALAWRRRKYMADATAVRLTRDPDALVGALGKMRGAAICGPLSAFVSHMAIVPEDGARARSLFSGSFVRMAPSYSRRIAALVKMGAQPVELTKRPFNRLVAVALAPVVAVLLALLSAALFLMVYVSIALSGLCTWVPAVLLHMILR